jgi:TolB-like protein
MPISGRDPARTIRFGVFELDTQARELSKRGSKLRLKDQAYQTLMVLLEHAGQVVAREQFKEKIWAEGTFVDFEGAINKTISQLRAVLGDDPQNPRFIETLSKQGYRFIAPVETGHPTPGGHKAIRSIVVLPFENLTGSAEQRFVADGMVEALIGRLGTVSGLRIISRTSAMACAIRSKSLLAIGRELGVDAAVEGSVMRSGNTVRVTARLVEIFHEGLIWQGKYDRGIENLLELYDDLAEMITKAITGSSAQSNLSRSRTPGNIAPEAHIAYLKGRYLWNRRNEKDLYSSIEEFQRALGASPNFAMAESGMADAYVLVGVWGLQPSHTAFRMARRSAERALELDDGLAEAHTCFAEVLKDYDWDWSASEREFKRAIALNPNYSTAHQRYAQLLLVMGRYGEAIAEMEMARKTDPLSPAINSYLPYVYLAARDYGRAQEEGRRAVDLEPYSALAHWQLGRACLFSGATKEGLSELESAAKLGGSLSIWWAELCFARGRVGDRQGAEAILNELVDRAHSTYVSPFDIALCFAGLEESNAALNYLEQAYQERVMRVIAIGDPELDALRSEPRFASLVHQLRIPALQIPSGPDPQLSLQQ